MGRPPSSEKSTHLSRWFDRHSKEISREAFAARLSIERQHVDRYARGERRPGLDTAFDIEEITAEITGGADVLKAREWVVPKDQRLEGPKKVLPKRQGRRRPSGLRKTR